MMPDLPNGFLYGLSEGYWHGLMRHDPEYRIEHRKSDKLTADARKNAAKAGLDPDAVPDVMVRVSVGVDGPGHGRTVCSLEGLALEAIGTEPAEGDALCPVCKIKIEQQQRIDKLERELASLRT